MGVFRYIRWKAAKNAVFALGRKIRNLVTGKSVLASEEIVARRRIRCQVCEYNELGQCQECLCNINLKTRFSDERCPRNLW